MGGGGNYVVLYFPNRGGGNMNLPHGSRGLSTFSSQHLTVPRLWLNKNKQIAW